MLDFQGNPLEAEASIKRALELDPNNAVAHAFYAEILIDQGVNNALKAADESKVAQQLAPNSLITHRARGYVLEATANYEEAVREYQEAIAINGNIPDLHLQLGINYSALGIYDQAVQEFGKANALNPGDPMPDYLSSRTYATVGEFAKARQYAETAVKDEPTNPRYHGNLGVMYYRTALFEDAVKELTLAVNGGLSDTGDKVEPIDLAPNAPRIAEIYFTYALALSKVGRCGETSAGRADWCNPASPPMRFRSPMSMKPSMLAVRRLTRRLHAPLSADTPTARPLPGAVSTPTP